MPESSYALALKKLSVRAYSTVEMRQLLVRAGHDSPDINETMEKLQAYGYLNDVRLAETLYTFYLERKPCGPALLKKKLLQKGLSKDLIQSTLTGYDEQTELQLASIITKKYLLRSKPEAGALARFLQRKGFNRDIILKMLNEHYSSIDM